MSTLEVLSSLFVLALIFGAVGWAAFALALLRTRHAEAEADKLAVRVWIRVRSWPGCGGSWPR